MAVSYKKLFHLLIETLIVKKMMQHDIIGLTKAT